MGLREEAVHQLEALLARHQSAMHEMGINRNEPETKRLKELLTSAHATIQRLAPPGSPYMSNCEAAIAEEFSSEVYKLDCLIGIVTALRHDYAAGLLAPVHELIRSEVFDDFLEMAEHLIENGYKDPAAMVIGGVLEQHLRRLAARMHLPTEVAGKPKKADLLNSELASASVYNKLDQKSVTSWLGLRNHAAHAKYDEYSVDQTRIMLLGVRDFLSRTTV